MTPTEYRNIRKQLGLTQAGLAALLGETRETISRRERSAGFVPMRDTWALRWLAEHMEQPGQKQRSNLTHAAISSPHGPRNGNAC